MAINIRNPEADALARRFAAMEGREITEAVIIALQEAIDRRIARETPRQTAERLLKKHGIRPRTTTGEALPAEAYHALDGA